MKLLCRIFCHVFGHKWKKAGRVNVIGPGEYLGNGMACYGVETPYDRYQCERCSAEESRLVVEAGKERKE